MAETKPGLAPGMEQVIFAGDTLEIADEDGQKFAVTANECKETMTFLKAFDEWFVLKQRSITVPIAKPLIDAMWTKTVSAYNELPLRIQRELPSMKHQGVAVVGHSH